MSLLDSLVAYWKLEEASGNRADSAGANTLTDNNTVTQNPGKVGSGAQFTKANLEYLSIADNAALSMGAGVYFTIVAWVYADSLAATNFIIAKDTTTNPNIEYALLFNNGTSRFRFRVSSTGAGVSATVDANNLGAPSTATWYFIACWYDGAKIYISVNDGTANTTNYTADVVDSGALFCLGARSDIGNYWDGRIDEVGIWKRVLTAAERSQLYNAGSGTTYPFLGGTGTAPLAGSGADQAVFGEAGRGATPGAASGADQTVFGEGGGATSTIGGSGTATLILAPAGGGMGSWVPMAGAYDFEALLKGSNLRVSHGEPHPELNAPALEREARAQQLAGLLADDEEVLLLVGAMG